MPLMTETFQLEFEELPEELLKFKENEVELLDPVDYFMIKDYEENGQYENLFYGYGGCYDRYQQ